MQYGGSYKTAERLGRRCAAELSNKKINLLCPTEKVKIRKLLGRLLVKKAKHCCI
jgi:hypothetical protein